MPFRIALALSLSVMLVGAASWWRFSTVQYVKPVLTTVEQLDAYGLSDDDFIRDFTEPKPEEVIVKKEPLSQTDIIGQQLIMDYIGLATSGGAGPQSINALAEQYASIIPTLSKPDKLGYQDVKMAPNTTSSLKIYSEELGKIYVTHSLNINKIYTSGIEGVSLDKAYYSFAKEASLEYRNVVNELRKLPVPLPLATFHLELINIHLSNLAAMESIAQAQEDPLVAFAGFVSANESSGREVAALEEIGKILKTNGI